MGKNSLHGTTTCYVRNNRADERFRPKFAWRGKDYAAAGRKRERELRDLEKEKLNGKA